MGRRGGIILNPVYKPILTSKKRYILITGGRGSSKSFSVSTIAEDLSFQENQVILFLRYTMSSAHLSIIPEFQEKIDAIGDSDFFDVKKTKIENIASGSPILFRGAKTSSGDQTANLKSIHGLSTLIIDEGEEFTDEKVFDKIDFSIRSKAVKNRIFIIMNPTTREHWTYKRWFEGYETMVNIDGFQIPISNHPDILHIHTTYLDNVKHLSKSFVSRLEKLKFDNPDKYKHVILGAYRDSHEGVIFKNWTEGEFDNSLPFCYGLDYGYFPDPLALVKVAVNKQKKIIYIQEKIYKTELSADDIVKLLESFAKKKSLIVCDTNEPRTTRKIRRAGYNIREVKKNRIADDIRDMLDYSIVITPDSTNMKKEARNYLWNDKKADLPIDSWNHGWDATRYAYKKLLLSRIEASYK